MSHQVATCKLEASQIPAGLGGKEETQWSQEGASGSPFPLCLPYLLPNLKGSSSLAVPGLCGSLWVPTSKPSIIFNNSSNPLTRVSWAQSFHNLVPLPFESSCPGEGEGWAEAIGPPLLIKSQAHDGWGHRAQRLQHLDWNLQVCTPMPVLLLEHVLPRNIQYLSPVRAVVGSRDAVSLPHRPPWLAEGSGRHIASLHDSVAQGIRTARSGQWHPCKFLAWRSGVSPAAPGLSSSFCAWVTEGMLPLGHHRLSLSLSPGACRLRGSSEVVGSEWKAHGVMFSKWWEAWVQSSVSIWIQTTNHVTREVLEAILQPKRELAE